MGQKSTRRRKKSRGWVQQPRRPEVPFLVLLAVSDRMGSRLSRSEAVFRGTLLAVLSPVALLASFFFVFREGIFEALVFLSVALLAFAFGQWRAIQWLDQKQAWRSIRR